MMDMLDRFLDWGPLGVLLAAGGIAQLVSALFPDLKGTATLRVGILLLVALFAAWKFVYVPAHLMGGFSHPPFHGHPEDEDEESRTLRR